MMGCARGRISGWGIVFLLATAQLGFGPGEAAAQRTRGRTGGRTTTYVAIPAVFPAIEARALLIREPGRDVVLLRQEDALPETLAMALAVLQRVREANPRPEQGQMIPITGFAITDPGAPLYMRSLGAVLARLASSEVSEVGNLGPGRWIRYRGR